MIPSTLQLPDGRQLAYQIRLSKRAKYMRMTFSPDKGLVVTQPAGVGKQAISNWMDSKLSWISQTLDQMETRAASLGLNTTHTPPARPQHIELPCINQTIRLVYQKTDSVQMTTHYSDDNILTVSGATDNTEFCLQVLQKWLQSYAKPHLGILLQQAAQETGLSYKSYRVKAQRSRWGSCSNLGNINLNYKLLLMPPEWTRYTLIHELCHTVEMNHSKRFWALVQQFIPEYKTLHKEMKQATAYLPHWVNHQIS